LTISVAKHSFTANAGGSSVTGGASIASYTFDFGDGTVVGPQTGSTASHTYASKGSYTVAVTVTATSGATATKQATAATQAIPPTARLLLGLTTTPTVMKADASYSTAGDYPIDRYTIDWGNGWTGAWLWSSGANVQTETFADCSLVSVTLTVTDTAGNVSAPDNQQYFLSLPGDPSPCM
jgi:PKD repeat protein